MSLRGESWERFEAEADRIGLSLRGAVPITVVESALAADPPPPGATHAVLLLQAGGAFWEQLRTLRSVDPLLDRHRDPLDAMTQRLATRLGGLLGSAYLGARFPFSSKLDFVSLGESIGVGARSRLAILIHPEFGPWIAFRMLLFVRDDHGIVPPSASVAQSPCDGCPAPCAAACPAQAFHAPGGSLDYTASFRYRLDHASACADACLARVACRVGARYRYPDDFLANSHRRAFEAGRAALAPKTGHAQGALF